MMVEGANVIKAKDLVLSYGYGRQEPVTKFTKIAANTKLQLTEIRSRQTGTGYKDYYYRILGTENALLINKNYYDNDAGFHDGVRIIEGFYNRQKEYGIRCRQLSEELNCPIEVALAFGPEYVTDFVNRIAELKVSGRALTDEELHELLGCGINRCKMAIYNVLDDEPLENVVSWMGQVNVGRVAKYLAEALPEAPKLKRKPRQKSRREEAYDVYCDSGCVGTSLAGLLASLQI